VERTKHQIIFLLLILIAVKLNASYRSEVYYAYINNRMDKWKSVIDRMNLIENKSDKLLHELVNYQYGYIGYCIGFDKKSEAKKYLDLAEKNIGFLEKNNYDLSVINAYKCAFYGFRIGLNKISAPINGFKSLEHGRTALELDKNNYFAWIQYGNIQFYMPAAFGGSKQEGIEYFIKAKELLEKNPDDLVENWNYLSLMVLIGQSYTYIDEPDLAKSVYEDILRLEPDFLYVKDELYPDLLKNMNE
jgi:hypothetical protein